MSTGSRSRINGIVITNRDRDLVRALALKRGITVDRVWRYVHETSASLLCTLPTAIEILCEQAGLDIRVQPEI